MRWRYGGKARTEKTRRPNRLNQRSTDHKKKTKTNKPIRQPVQRMQATKRSVKGVRGDDGELRWVYPPFRLDNAPDKRIIQAMVVLGCSEWRSTQYKKPDNGLYVYRIPESEKASFVSWLSKPMDRSEAGIVATDDLAKWTKHKAEVLKNLAQPTRVSYNYGVLKTLAQVYKKQVDARTRIGFVCVPMRPGSVVGFVGIHGVNACRDPNAWRIVKYVRCCVATAKTKLPSTLAEEQQQQRAPSAWRRGAGTAIENAVAAYEVAHGKGHYGLNEEVIKKVLSGDDEATFRKHVGMLVDDGTQSAAKARDDTPEMAHLRENGFFVLPDVITQKDCRHLCKEIIGLYRTTLHRIGRPGQSRETRAYAEQMKDAEFLKALYSDERLCNMRFFEKNSVAQCRRDDYAGGKRFFAQGRQGITKEAGMIPVYGHPALTMVKLLAHPHLKKALGVSKLFLTQHDHEDSCSVRGCGSAELKVHHDEPVSMPQTELL